MKTIGLLGGMSWESSQEYYRILNQETRKSLGGTSSAKSLMYSYNFHELVELMGKGCWDEIKEMLLVQSQNLKNAGADFIVICTNTMHKMAPDIEAHTGLKVLHIVDVTGQDIQAQGLKKIALLGTIATMEGSFYPERLAKQYGIELITPNEADRKTIHSIIFDELVKGIISDESRKKYQVIIERLAMKGAEGVILGCTEIPLLITQEDVSIPTFDTTGLHAKAAVRYALSE